MGARTQLRAHMCFIEPNLPIRWEGHYTHHSRCVEKGWNRGGDGGDDGDGGSGGGDGDVGEGDGVEE